MTNYIPVPQPPLTPEQIATGKDVEIRRLTARVHELEQHLETQRTATYRAVEREHTAKAALTQAHQQLQDTVKFQEAQYLKEHEHWGECQWKFKLQQAVEALGFYARHEHWMSPTENGDSNLLIAHGPHFDKTSNGWVEAETILATHKDIEHHPACSVCGYTDSEGVPQPPACHPDCLATHKEKA